MIRAAEPMTPVQYVSRILLQHKGKMSLFFVVIVSGVAAVTFFGPRSYVSQAKLLVRLGRENVTLDPTATMGQAPFVAVPTSREHDINSIIEVVKSRVLLEKVVDTLGPAVVLGKEPLSTAEGRQAAAPSKLDPDAAAVRYSAVLKLTRALEVDAVKKSNVIAVSYEDASPELAQAILARLVEFALDENLLINRTAGAPRFLAEQAERQSKELTLSEAELTVLKNKTGLVVPETQKLMLATRVSRLEDELLQTDSARAASEAEVAHLRAKLAVLPQTQVTAHTKGLPNQAADAMRSQLYALQLKEGEMLTRYPEQHPEIQLLRKQIASAKEILTKEEGSRDQVATGPSKTYEETQVALLKQEPLLVSLKAKAEILREQLARETAALKTLNENLVALAKVQRHLDLHETLYRKYAENLEQAQIDQALRQERISNISIVQPATYELKPVRPKKLTNLAVGCFFALLGSVALAAAAEYRKPSADLPKKPQALAPLANGSSHQLALDNKA